MVINPLQLRALEPLARRYVWWKTPSESLANPHRLLAQVMNIGAWQDVEQLREVVDDDILRDVLRTAQPGEFNRRSWNFWHLCLEMPYGPNRPPLPQRGSCLDPPNSQLSGEALAITSLVKARAVDDGSNTVKLSLFRGPGRFPAEPVGQQAQSSKDRKKRAGIAC